MDLILALRQTKRLSDFVEGGPLTATVTDIGIEAAVDALSKLEHAKDKLAQVWTALNHLHAAAAPG